MLEVLLILRIRGEGWIDLGPFTSTLARRPFLLSAKFEHLPQLAIV